MRVLLISTYELGRQPFGLASPAAWLRRAGFDVECADTTQHKLPEAAVMTENAATVVSLPPTAVEPIETFVEAVIALCECDPRSLTGRVLTSLSLLVELERPVKSLDGRSLVDGWQPDQIDRARLRPGYLDANF